MTTNYANATNFYTLNFEHWTLNFMMCTFNDYELREWHEFLYFELWGLNFKLYDMYL